MGVPAADVLGSASAPSDEPTCPRDSPVLLLVEDDPSTASAMRRILKRWGWDVTVAETVAAAVQYLRGSSPPQCVVLDLMLPDGDGTNVLRLIRRQGIATRVIVTSGSSDPSRLGEVASLKPELFLAKPIDLNALYKGLGH